MRVRTILNWVQKFHSFVHGTAHLTERSGRPVLEVQLRARANSRPICSGCKRTRPGYDVLSVRRYQFVPFWGILVFFLYVRRRVDCPTCGVKAEGLNNKAKLATRKAYGFRTYDALEIVLYPTLGDLPEPEHAHAFF